MISQCINNLKMLSNMEIGLNFIKRPLVGKENMKKVQIHTRVRDNMLSPFYCIINNILFNRRHLYVFKIYS